MEIGDISNMFRSFWKDFFFPSFFCDPVLVLQNRMPDPKSVARQYQTFVPVEIFLLKMERKLEGGPGTGNIKKIDVKRKILQSGCSHRHIASLWCRIRSSFPDCSALFRRSGESEWGPSYLSLYSMQLVKFFYFLFS